jgi:hypothetical protein
MHFIGDLSKEDVRLLTVYAANARLGILEFGVGGSTQLLSMASDPLLPMMSVDTSQEWIVKTKGVLDRLHYHRKRPIEFVLYADWTKKSQYDLVFNDGLRRERYNFALWAWNRMPTGATMLWHDCRRPDDRKEIVEFVQQTPTVACLELSKDGSNLAAIKKGPLYSLENWHAGQEPWELGIAPLPTKLPWEP